jgi:hypothetical protein
VRVSAEAKASALRRIEKRSSRRGASVLTTRQSRPFRRSPLITLWISACSARVRWVRPWSSRKGVRAAGGTVAATAWPPGLIRPQWVEVEGLPRFNLIHRPLSDFFPVYNEGRGRTHRPDAESGGHCKDDLLGGVFICAVRKRPNWHPNRPRVLLRHAVSQKCQLQGHEQAHWRHSRARASNVGPDSTKRPRSEGPLQEHVRAPPHHELGIHAHHAHMRSKINARCHPSSFFQCLRLTRL